jgi:hypothetical protein
MAMKLIKKEEVIIEDMIYIMDIYSNGEKESVVKYPKPSEIALEEPLIPKPTQLDLIQ